MNKNNVKQAFEKVYDEDYKLIKLWEMKEIGHVCYAIIYNASNVLVEFEVANDTSVYAARSNECLLTREHEIVMWSRFMSLIEGK